MPEYTDTFPDLKAAAIRVLLNAGAGAAGNRVYSSLPTSPTWPLVLVKRIGGTPAHQAVLDRANLQIEVWGTSQKECFDIANSCRKSIIDARGSLITWTGGKAWVTDAYENLGPQDLPDPVTGRDRTIFGLVITGRSAQ
jgi:hypothetical protein